MAGGQDVLCVQHRSAADCPHHLSIGVVLVSQRFGYCKYTGEKSHVIEAVVKRRAAFDALAIAQLFTQPRCCEMKRREEDQEKTIHHNLRIGLIGLPVCVYIV